jgi:hypothetical protein
MFKSNQAIIILADDSRNMSQCRHRRARGVQLLYIATVLGLFCFAVCYLYQLDRCACFYSVVCNSTRAWHIYEYQPYILRLPFGVRRAGVSRWPICLIVGPVKQPYVAYKQKISKKMKFIIYNAVSSRSLENRGKV